MNKITPPAPPAARAVTRTGPALWTRLPAGRWQVRFWDDADGQALLDVATPQGALASRRYLAGWDGDAYHSWVNDDKSPLNRQAIADRVTGFPRVAADRPDLKQAAVAVCVTEVAGTLSLLLTRRAARLSAHPGQWALPGGRREPGETPAQGALRELAEEVGVVLSPGCVLGTLDDYVTRSGYVMTPVVCWAGPDGERAGTGTEVSSVHHVPLADLDAEPRFLTIPESDAPVIQVPLLGGYLHAPTGAIVYQFCQAACRGTVTRVAHYEQPVFAWR
jgi:8-oxo-dGTP pyrophosphatase MutT (NUDIX family)